MFLNHNCKPSNKLQITSFATLYCTLLFPPFASSNKTLRCQYSVYTRYSLRVTEPHLSCLTSCVHHSFIVVFRDKIFIQWHISELDFLRFDTLVFVM